MPTPSFCANAGFVANEMNELVVVVASRIQFFYGFTPINMLLPFPPGKYTMFLLPLNVFATSLAASILLNSINAGPALLVACEINFADSDSPSALITAASLSCSDFMTSNFALSASCCATCFASIAREYSWLKLKCVNATSSNKIPKSSARFLKLFAIYSVTSCLLVNNSSALYCATVAFNTSFPIDGNTRSS
jgi:hypothetical protein